VHRAVNNQIALSLKPTDIMRDVFEPVDVMLFRRGSKFDVILDCPKDLVVMSDPLRLKQIVLNLSRYVEDLKTH